MKTSSNLIKKILFVIPSLKGGGAERMCQIIAEYIDKKRFETTIVIFQDQGDYQISPYVRLICLGKRNKYDFFKMVNRLSNLLRQISPGLVVSILIYSHLITKLSIILSGAHVKHILIEQNAVFKNLSHVRFSWAWLLIAYWIYPDSLKIVCPSNGIAAEMVNKFKVSENKIQVVYNPVDIKKIQELSRQPVGISWLKDKKCPVVLSIGRLTEQKGYKYLLKAFSMVLKETNAKLIIIGEGKYRKMLENISVRLGIENCVALPGFMENPFNLLAYSDIFVLSSLWEGFGMVIVEAMACGIPVIATDCNYGPREIIKDDINGVLVPPGNADSLSCAMLKLLKDIDLRKRLAEQGKSRSFEFESKKIVAQYEAIFNET